MENVRALSPNVRALSPLHSLQQVMFRSSPMTLKPVGSTLKRTIVQIGRVHESTKTMAR